MSKHSPGPWKLHELTGGVFSGETQVHGRHWSRAGEDEDVAMADARLIAAAPEMLELLERARYMLVQHAPGQEDWAEEADALVAKVKGDGT